MADEPRRKPSIPGPGEYMGLGIQFVIAILLFLYVGRWLDERLGTEPWLLLLGVFVGFGAGMYTIFRHVGPGPGGPDRKERP